MMDSKLHNSMTHTQMLSGHATGTIQASGPQFSRCQRFPNGFKLHGHGHGHGVFILAACCDRDHDR
jgi:hypothetical protein